VTISPAANQFGTTIITVTVSDTDGGSFSDAFVLTVNSVNDLPTISDIADQSTNEDTPTSAIPFTVGDTETQADSLTLAAQSSNMTLAPVANITFGGSGANRTVAISPAANQFGMTIITVTVSDADGGSASDAFTLTVTAVNDLPVASDDSYGTGEDTALIVPAPGVLTNDTDADSEPLTAIWVSGPSHGTLVLSVNGSFTYTPSLDYDGPDSFTYKAKDSLVESNVATVAINVHTGNDAPITVNDSYAVTESTVLSVAAPGV